MTIDPAINAAYLKAFARLGVSVSVTFKRVTGSAPGTVTTVTATVNAVVRGYNPDTTSPAREGYATTKVGSITEGARSLIVMATDLQSAGFPLPVKKNDKIIMDTGDQLTITDVDSWVRAAAGAIELKASGSI